MVAGLVDHQSERTPLAVFAQVDNALGKSLVRQSGHRDQEMIRQINGCRIIGHISILAANMQKQFDSGLVWFRRDLRVDDNPALCAALQQCRQVFCAFIFDREILAPLPRADRRVEFIQASLVELDASLRALASRPEAGLIVRHGLATELIPALALELQVQAVFAAHDYEPQAIARDARVRGALASRGVALYTFKDHVISSAGRS